MKENLTLEKFLCPNRHLDNVPYTLILEPLSLSYYAENVLVASQNGSFIMKNESEPIHDGLNIFSPSYSPS